MPITLNENLRIIEEFDGTSSLALLTGRDLDDDPQEDFVVDNAQVCIDCHMPIGGSFTEDPLALLPFGEGDSEVSGNEAVVSDGVGCVMLGETVVALSLLATRVLTLLGDGSASLDRLGEALLLELGEPESGDARSLVQTHVDDLVEVGVLTRV